MLQYFPIAARFCVVQNRSRIVLIGFREYSLGLNTESHALEVALSNGVHLEAFQVRNTCNVVGISDVGESYCGEHS